MRQFLLSAVVAVCVASLAALPAQAQEDTTTTTAASAPVATGDLSLTTAYPGVAVEPGTSITLDLTLTSPEAETVVLAVESAPDGWEATVRGGGFVVNQVQTDPFAETPPELTLSVPVPDDAAAGDYPIEISATAPSGTVRLPVIVTVQETVPGETVLTATSPGISIRSGVDAEFRVSLENQTASEQTYSLSAEAPPGWFVTVRPTTGQTDVATLVMEAGATQELTVTATPPDSVTSGEYPLLVSATSGTEAVSAELSVTITGTYSLEVTTVDQRLSATASAGEEQAVNLILFNTGSADIQNVTLSATPPSGWEVTFEPEVVDIVPAGATADVTALLTPDPDAVAGDYVVSVSASSEFANGNADLRITVETSTIVAIVAFVIIGVAVLILLWVFRRFGRR